MKTDQFVTSLYNKKEREDLGVLVEVAVVRELLVAKLQLYTRLTITRGGKTEEARRLASTA